MELAQWASAEGTLQPSPPHDPCPMIVELPNPTSFQDPSPVQQTPLTHPAVLDPQAAFRVEITDLDGRPIQSILVGESFRLQVYVDDLRDNPQGTFYAMVDTQFDAALADFATWIDLVPKDLRSGASYSRTGLINNAGGVFGLDYDYRPTARIYSIDLVALKAGELKFSTNPGEAPHFLLQFGRGTPLTVEEVTFGGATLAIVDAIDPGTFSGFVPEVQPPYMAQRSSGGAEGETIRYGYLAECMPLLLPRDVDITLPSITESASESKGIDDEALLVALDFLFPHDEES